MPREHAPCWFLTTRHVELQAPLNARDTFLIQQFADYTRFAEQHTVAHGRQRKGKRHWKTAPKMRELDDVAENPPGQGPRAAIALRAPASDRTVIFCPIHAVTG